MASMRLMQTLLLIMMLAVGLAVADTSVSTTNYQSCGGDNSALIISGSNFSFIDARQPNGDPGALIINANVTSLIPVYNTMWVSLSATVLNINVKNEVDNICSLTDCPKNSNANFTVSKNVTVGTTPPPGSSLHIRITVYNQVGGRQTLVGCYAAQLDFKSAPYSTSVQAAGLSILFLSAIMGAISIGMSLVQSFANAGNEGAGHSHGNMRESVHQANHHAHYHHQHHHHAGVAPQTDGQPHAAPQPGGAPAGNAAGASGGTSSAVPGGTSGDAPGGNPTSGPALQGNGYQFNNGGHSGGLGGNAAPHGAGSGAPSAGGSNPNAYSGGGSAGPSGAGGQAQAYSYNTPAQSGGTYSGHTGAAPSSGGPANLHGAAPGTSGSGTGAAPSSGSPGNFHSAPPGTSGASAGPANFHMAGGPTSDGGPISTAGYSHTGPAGPETFHAANGPSAGGLNYQGAVESSGHAGFTVQETGISEGPGGLSIGQHAIPGAPAPAGSPGFAFDGGPVGPTGPSGFAAPNTYGYTGASGPGGFYVSGGDAAAAAGGQHLNVGSGAAAAPSGGGSDMSAPWFFDIIHYFQFVTLTGQLQLDYPSVFATFTRFFHFSNGGVHIAFIDSAVVQWTGVATVWMTNPPTNTTDSTLTNPLGYVVSQDDVGLTNFIIQTGNNPANYFPTTLVTLLFIAGCMMCLSLIVSVLMALGAVLFRKKSDEDATDQLAMEVKEQKERCRAILKRAVLVRFSIANAVRIWMITQYPLTVAATYWLSHYAPSGVAPVSITAVAVVVVVLFSVGVPATIIALVLRVKPVNRLFSEPAYLETLGPFYDQLRPEKIGFVIATPVYYALQAFIVGGFPRMNPRVVAQTLGTRQWILSLVQPLLLVVVEIAFIISLAVFNPFADRFSSRVQWAITSFRLVVLICLCTFVAPIYKQLQDGSKVSVEDVNNNYIGSSWTVKDVVGYIAALAHILLIVALLVLLIRRMVMWCIAFYRSRRAASQKSSSKAGNSTLGGNRDSAMVTSSATYVDNEVYKKDEYGGDGIVYSQAGVNSGANTFLQAGAPQSTSGLATSDADTLGDSAVTNRNSYQSTNPYGNPVAPAVASSVPPAAVNRLIAPPRRDSNLASPVPSQSPSPIAPQVPSGVPHAQVIPSSGPLQQAPGQYQPAGMQQQVPSQYQPAGIQLQGPSQYQSPVQQQQMPVQYQPNVQQQPQQVPNQPPSPHMLPAPIVPVNQVSIMQPDSSPIMQPVPPGSVNQSMMVPLQQPVQYGYQQVQQPVMMQPMMMQQQQQVPMQQVMVPAPQGGYYIVQQPMQPIGYVLTPQV